MAKALGVSRSAVYYRSKKLARDWELKNQIEKVLTEEPSYGYRRVADALHINKKRIQRVMRLFGMKAYRRRGKKPKKKGVSNLFYPNLLKTNYPERPNRIWVSDFTYIPFQNKFVYLATVMDLFTREIVGWSVLTNHSAQLTLQSLFIALAYHRRPEIFHSDNGREYGARQFIRALTEFGINISRLNKKSPWENGYQESLRELTEEAEIKASADSLEKVAVVDFHNTNSDGKTFTCRVHVYFVSQWEGEPQETEEMLTPTWFDKDALPLNGMMPADKQWLPVVLTGKKIIAEAHYSPFQKTLLEKVKLRCVDSLSDA